MVGAIKDLTKDEDEDEEVDKDEEQLESNKRER